MKGRSQRRESPNRPVPGPAQRTRRELVVRRQSADVTIVTERDVTARWYDSIKALQPHLTSDELRAAETICWLWSGVTRARVRLVGAYEAGPAGSRSAEPDLTDREADQHARLNRALKAMGPGCWAVINALFYGHRGHHVADTAAALDRAHPYLVANTDEDCYGEEIGEA